MAKKVSLERAEFDRLVGLVEQNTSGHNREFAEGLRHRVVGPCLAEFRESGVRCGKAADHRTRYKQGMSGFMHEARQTFPQEFMLYWDDEGQEAQPRDGDDERSE
jgi:hypothetical protein